MKGTKFLQFVEFWKYCLGGSWLLYDFPLKLPLNGRKKDFTSMPLFIQFWIELDILSALSSVIRNHSFLWLWISPETNWSGFLTGKCVRFSYDLTNLCAFVWIGGLKPYSPNVVQVGCSFLSKTIFSGLKSSLLSQSWTLMFMSCKHETIYL